MFKSYLLTALRTVRRGKAFSLLNILGLAVGIAASILIFLVIRYETGYDADQSRKDRIYRVVTDMSNRSNGEVIERRGTAPARLSEVIHQDVPGLEKVSAVMKVVHSQIYIGGKNSPNEKRFMQRGIYAVEPEFFDMFDFTWLVGNASALKDPYTVVLSASVADQYFGNWQAAMGQRIEMWSFRVPLRVVGIYQDRSEHTDLPVVMAPSFATYRALFPDWFNYEGQWHYNFSSLDVFVLLSPNQRTAGVEGNLASIVKKYYAEDKVTVPTRTRLSLQPLGAMHLDERYETFLGNSLSKKVLWSLGLIGVFLLAVACINFINLSTAQSVKRAKEIGVRKVLGGRRGQLLGQFLLETALITLVAMVLGCVLAQVGIPLLQSIMGKPVTADWLHSPTLLVFLLLTGAGVVLLAGSYPGLVLSGFDAIAALKSKISTRTVGGLSLRRTLVVIQFVIAQLLIIGTLVVVRQMQFFRTRPLGFDQAAIALVDLPSDSTDRQEYGYLKRQLEQIPGVVGSSLCFEPPAGGSLRESEWYYDNNPVKEDYKIDRQLADADYLKTFHIRLLAGRMPDTGRSEILVNEMLVHRLGLRSPADILGKTIGIENHGWQYRVIGVMADYNNRPLRERIRPLVLMPQASEYQQLAVRLQPEAMKETMARVERVFTGIYPSYMFDYRFFDEQIARFYLAEATTAQLVKVFALLAIFISCLGLYGLVSFMAVQKTREVGIRKVLGASVGSILYLFSREFTLMPVIAMIVTAPVGYLCMSRWLSGFYYHITLGWEFFLATLVLSLVIAWATVGYRALRAAQVSPVKSLKTE